MMKYLFTLMVVSIFSTPSFAWDYSDEPYDQRGEPNYRYEAPSGKRYQYDLSNPADEIRYEVDPRAQLRDEINVDPRIELDCGLGACGGGAEW